MTDDHARRRRRAERIDATVAAVLGALLLVLLVPLAHGPAALGGVLLLTLLVAELTTRVSATVADRLRPGTRSPIRRHDVGGTAAGLRVRRSSAHGA